MNINPISSAPGLGAYAKAGTGKVVDAGKSSAAKGERVEFSDVSTELKKVKDSVDALPDVRLKMVEEIKQKIKNNDYPLENNLDEAIKEMLREDLLLV